MTTEVSSAAAQGAPPSGRLDRRAALRELDAVWAQVRGTQGLAGPALVLVQAPAGHGKSWLARRWLEGLRARQADTAAWPVPAGPLLPGLLHAGFQTLQHERDPAFLAAAASLLPGRPWPVLALETGLPADRGALWLTLWRVLERAAQRLGGLCLVFEDVHAYFPDDLAALQSLWARVQHSRAPLLLLLTARPEGGTALWESLGADAAGLQVRRLDLGALDRGGTESLCAELLQSENFPAGLIDWVQACSEGHPLHSTELLHFLMAGGLLRDLGGTWQFLPPPEHATPRGLEAVLTARLHAARHEPELWQALSALATVDRPLLAPAWERSRAA